MNSSALINNCESSESGAMEGVDVDSDSGSDNDWEGIEEEVSLSFQTLCLFCPEVFNSAELMFEHCQTQHMFDLVSYCKKMDINSYSYIKFINYVRSHKLSPSVICEITKISCPWTSDDYMKPYNVSDPLLTFDFENYIEEKMKERMDIDGTECTVTIPQARLDTLLQELHDKSMKLKVACERIDKMKLAAKTVLLCNNQMCSGVNNRSSYQEDKSSNNEDDNYYFSTYDHFAIHHEMLQDKIRTLAYQDAILNNPEVFHNKRVLDVGCGTSILSMFAAKAGASFVMGVDRSDVIFQAMDIVRENNYDQVIDLFKGRVEDMPDPEQKMDIIVSEWMGYFLLFEGMLDSIIYAREKFLVPGGHIFPDRCTLSLLAVCDIEKYKEYVDFWDNVYGFKMTAMKKDVIKEANVETVKPETACCKPVIVKELDLTTCQTSDSEFTTTFDLVMSRACAVTAIVGYFDCFFDKGLAHKVVLSTSPESPSTHWKQTMFLLENPVQVIEGEVVPCKISCRRNRRDPRSLIVKLNFGKYHNQYYLS
ncbi:protein arginine N-methyltransferase 3 [Trichonephila clavata]|uniref:type I protein arginine methyltransferase n=1 Tax=Trichonephila clavata TaxID=2740835 RepID=A0A8X6HDP9_TRICU|nr:protein arginine N-methyltransferase 3 [Trichonephila clavata]